ncbi:hypothetical protein ACS3SW_17895 [Roseobacteraceae bacterium S113]
MLDTATAAKAPKGRRQRARRSGRIGGKPRTIWYRMIRRLFLVLLMGAILRVAMATEVGKSAIDTTAQTIAQVVAEEIAARRAQQSGLSAPAAVSVQPVSSGEGAFAQASGGGVADTGASQIAPAQLTDRIKVNRGLP